MMGAGMDAAVASASIVIGECGGTGSLVGSLDWYGRRGAAVLTVVSMECQLSSFHICCSSPSSLHTSPPPADLFCGLRETVRQWQTARKQHKQSFQRRMLQEAESRRLVELIMVEMLAADSMDV